MRIAIVTQGYLVGGGVPAIARWLREGLTDSGHEVHVHDLAASSRDPRSRRLLSPASWRQDLVPESSAADPGLFQWGANWVEFESQRYRPRASLTATLDCYDIIQVVAGGPALALAAREAQPPKVLQVATTLLLERRARLPGMSLPKRAIKTLSLRPLHRLEVKALRSVDEVIVENRWMEQWVREQGQPNVVCAPPGIDTDFFHPIGDWDSSRPIVLFGRLSDSRKDWPTAVEAYEQFVGATGLGNALVLAGKGPLHPTLLRKLEMSPLRDRIMVREDVPGGELPALLGSGSVFLQSSLEEGLGLAGLEAMACGLPVVATATVGTTEYVRDGENGVLVALGRAAGSDLARGLAQVLGSPEAQEMSANAVETVLEGYSSTAAMSSFVRVHSRLFGASMGGTQ